MMMPNLLLMLTLLAGLISGAQPPLSLKAYKQVVIPGTVPVGISDDAPPSSRIGKRVSTNYYLYLVSPPKEAVQPLQVWINKKPYKITVETVARTPVEHTSRNIPTRPVTTVLVAKTGQKVVRLQPAAPLERASLPARAQKLVDSSELVVAYKWKGKTYYKALDKITELEPEMME